MIAMAGASKEHGIIHVTPITGLFNSFRDKQRPCRPFGSGNCAHACDTKSFYPDVSVFCGVPDVESQNNWNPQTVIVILPESTAPFGRNRKSAVFRQLPPLKELC